MSRTQLLSLSLVVLVTTSLVAADYEYSCPRGSIKSQNAKNEPACFLFERFPAQFLTAERLCRASNGHLASVEDKYRNTFLAQYGKEAFGILRVENFWLGAHDLKRSGRWEWIDHRAWSFVKWAKGQPNRATDGADCAAMSLEDGDWYANDCYDAKPYVCELPPVKTEVPSTSLPPTTREPTTTRLPTTTTAASPDEPCPPDWHFDVLTDTCVLVLASRGWQADEKACEEQKATLASVHFPSDTAFLKAILHGAPATPHARDVSIGLVETKRNEWRWLDGSPLDYKNWDQGFPHPSLPGQQLRCATMFTSTADARRVGRWHHVPCSINQQAQALCRKPADWSNVDVAAAKPRRL